MVKILKSKPERGFKRFTRIYADLVMVIAVALLSGCSPVGPTRYQGGFFGTFDTFVQVILYADSEQSFEGHFLAVQDMFTHYHRLFNIFESFDGVNNLRTVNENAGIAPVAVEQEVIYLLKISRQAYFDTDGAINVTLGPVLSIWHDYRLRGSRDVENATLPTYGVLREAAALADINGLVIDAEVGTVFLTALGMSLDVGATAKSFAASRAAALLRERGVSAAIIDAGGDVVTIGESPVNGGQPWSVGVRDFRTNSLFDTVRARDMAAATSGGYIRHFIVDGTEYNHIIDPVTLMPATRYAFVTILHEDANVAEMLSTALFILPFEAGYALARRFDAAAVWVFLDGTAEYNARYGAMSVNFGA